MAVGAGLVVGGVDAVLGATTPGHTHFAVDADQLQSLRELRTAAAERIAKMRRNGSGDPDDLEAAETELAVLDEALEEIDEALKESAPDGG